MIIICLVIFILLCFLLYKYLCAKLLNTIFLKSDKYHINKSKYDGWISTSNVSNVYIKSFDGLQLSACKIENNSTDKYVILVHGVNANNKTLYPQARIFDKLGYNTLLIDQRTCGLSQGKYYTYGYYESLDLLKWIDYLISINPNISICLYGVSMGAATVLQTLGLKLPSNVKCSIDDCGYSSLEEELNYYLNYYYNIKFTKPLLYIIEKIMIKNFGFCFDDCNQKLALHKNDKPLLIIHSKIDDVVPFEMADKIYNSTNAIKVLYVVNDISHGRNYSDDNFEFNVNNFLKQYFV